MSDSFDNRMTVGEDYDETAPEDDGPPWDEDGEE